MRWQEVLISAAEVGLHSLCFHPALEWSRGWGNNDWIRRCPLSRDIGKPVVRKKIRRSAQI